MDTRLLGTALGIVRTGVGASLVVAPRWAGRIWVGDDADGDGTAVFARALGARDVVLGSGILAATATHESRLVTRLIQLGALADLADMTATLIAWRNLEGRRRWMMPAIAAGVGVAGTLVSLMAEKADPDLESDPIAQFSSEDPATADGIVDQQAAVLEQMGTDSIGRENSHHERTAAPT